MNVGRKRIGSYQKGSVRKVARKSYSVPRAIGPAAVFSGFPKYPRRVGQGNSTSATMHYFQKFSVNPGSVGFAGYQQFRLSSIFDPDFTGVGSQPMGHDQYALLFEKYLVMSVDYKVIIKGVATDTLAFVGIQDTSTTDVDPARMIEQGQYEFKVISIIGGSTDVTEFTGHVDMPKAHGVSYKAYIADDTYRGTFGNNPSEEMYLNIGLGDLTVGDPAAISCVIQLTYNCKLFGSALTTRS